jgi:MFS family permease
MLRPGVAYALVLGALFVGEVASAYQIATIYAALPSLRRVFADPVGVGWTITSAFLVSAMVAALCGRLGDLLGRRATLLVVLALCCCGSLISALSSTLLGVVVGAAVQGVAGAALPLCFGLARQHLPPVRVPFAVGTLVAGGGLGAAAGLLVGGVVVDHFSWSGVFLGSALVNLAGLAAICWVVPGSAAASRSASDIDMARGVLFAPAIGGLLLCVSKAHEWGWRDSRLGTVLVVSVLVLAFWIRHQLRQRTPLINLRLMADRQVATAYACMALVGMGAMQSSQILVIFLQQPASTLVGFGLTATAAGAVLLPSNLVSIIAGPISGRVAQRLDARRALVYASLPVIGSWTGIALWHDRLWFVTSVLVVAQLGLFGAYAAIANLIVEAVPEGRTSEATGLMAVFRATFMAVGAQAISLLLATSTVPSPSGGTAVPAPDAYLAGFGYIAATGLATLLLALSIPRRDRIPEPAPEGALRRS